ncbi:MAG: conjugal transfer protein TraH [Desulfobacterales bacterium]|nr:conjugal transfer protein TraH [Desulfobacterales bacterium]
MKKKLLYNIIIFIIILSFSINAIAADWLEDWMGDMQSSSTGTNYFETQKRGFTTFGNFSTRWRSPSDYLVSAQMPNFKLGCGGVDIFLGSFDIMKFEYLVQKMQRLMGSSAAAFAFSVALGVLSEKFSSDVKNFTGIIDKFNQLQLDECKAQQAVRVFGESVGKEGPLKTEALMNFAQSTGFSSLWKEITQKSQAPGQGQITSQTATTIGGTNMEGLMSGCNNILQKFFLTDGSVILNVGREQGLPDEYLYLIRGILGDIATNKSNVSFPDITPCPKNNYSSQLDALVTGRIQYRDDGYNCIQRMIKIDNVTYSNLQEWVGTMIQNISKKKSESKPYTVSESNFLNKMSNLEKIISTEIFMNNTSESISNQLKYYISIIYAYHNMRNLFMVMDKNLKTISEALKNNQGGNDPKTCNIELLAPIENSLKDLNERFYNYIEQTQNEYINVANEFYASVNNSKIIQERADKAMSLIAKRFLTNK